MRLRALQILADPADHRLPLRLVAWAWRGRDGSAEETAPQVIAPPMGAAAGVAVPDLLAPRLGDDPDALEGALVEPASGRWYALRDGIPHLVRAALRHRDLETPILDRLRALPPATLAALGFAPVSNGHPGASERFKEPWLAPDTLDEADRRILHEEEYWSGFFRMHWDAGDIGMFDMDVRGTHPTFWPVGVRALDDRDRTRRWGLWPDHVGDFLFAGLRPWIERESARLAPAGETLWGWDAGCGGGQFGLFGAKSGVTGGARMVGTDVALGALACARQRALETGAPIDYIRAESAHPPLRPGSLRLLMCKDTLHHEPHADAVAARWRPLLAPGARGIVYDHIGVNKVGRAVVGWMHRRLVPRIRARYPCDPAISPFFESESANEEAATDTVLSGLTRLFPRHRMQQEVRIYHDIDGLCWYAFGRMRPVARLVALAFRWADPLMRALWGPEFLAFQGEFEPSDSACEGEGETA